MFKGYFQLINSLFLCLVFFVFTGKVGEELGCEDIVGVDISETMIDIGRAAEKDHPLGIIYHVSDVLHLTKPEKKFDFVIAFYMLNYAKTRDELEKMVQIISEQLHNSDKAHFLSITWNVCTAENMVNSDVSRKYGYCAEAQTPLVDGTEIKNTHFRKLVLNISNGYLSKLLVISTSTKIISNILL